MKTKILPIYWNGRAVGHISSPNVDNFNFYGAWKPLIDEPAYNDFLAAIESDEGAPVLIGDEKPAMKGFVQIEPSEEIEIKLQPR
jgi:hypothetical protein